jgi:hypothetical protein
MNIYLISQNDADGYDTYDAAVVAANSEEEARNINPSGEWRDPPYKDRTWAATPELVKVKLIGICTGDARPPGIILKSYIAG